jgi:NADH-quinone oxidoreductase subunit J
MLVRTQALFSTKEDKGRKASGVVLVLIFMIGLGALLLVSGLSNPQLMNLQMPPVDFKAIGEEMLTYYSPVLIALGLVLGGSIIGALALARREDIETKDG